MTNDIVFENESAAQARGWGIVNLSGIMKNPPSFLASTVVVMLFIGAVIYIFFWCWAIGQTYFALSTFEPNNGNSNKVSFFVYLISSALGGPLLIWCAVLNYRTVVQANRTHIASVIHDTSQRLGHDIEEVQEVSGGGPPIKKTTTKTASLEARLGSLHSLETLANTSNQDRPAIHEMIAAFVSRSKIGIDVEVALDILARRYEQSSVFAVERAPVRIDGLKYSTREFNRLKFTHAILENCEFIETKINALEFIGSTLPGLLFGKMDCKKLKISSRCDLESAKFVQSIVPNALIKDSSVSSASFVSAELGGARFENCKLQLADFLYVDLRQTDFINCQMDGAKFIQTWLAPNTFDESVTIDPQQLQDSYCIGKWAHPTIICSHLSPKWEMDEAMSQTEFALWKSDQVNNVIAYIATE